MDGTEGLVRGQPVSDTGYPIRIPVGQETLGRIINVIGEPIDERGPIKTDQYVNFLILCNESDNECFGPYGSHHIGLFSIFRSPIIARRFDLVVPLLIEDFVS